MTQQEYDIQRQVDALMQKLLETWRNEGKWDGNNPSEYYGLDKDPVLRILLTAFVYQINGLKVDLQNFEENTISEFEDTVLPYNLTQAVPALTMIKTAKAANVSDTMYCDESTTFLVKRESLRLKEDFSFIPLFRTKILGANVNSITKVASDKWNVNFDLTDQDASLDSMGFMIIGQRFSDLNVYWNNEKVPLVKADNFDRFPLNSWFNDANIVYNKSMLFGVETKWFDLWNSCNLNYYMVDPSYSRQVDTDALNLVFEFKGMVQPFQFEVDNLIINCFPAVNVVKKEFNLSASDPIVKLDDEQGYLAESNDAFRNPSSATPENNHKDFFMNLVMNDDSSLNDMDRFVIRRFGCERFNINELLNLAHTLSKRYESDFYAFQKIQKLQNAEKMRRLDLVVKDVVEIIKANGTPQSGVYAILKRGRNAYDANLSLHLSGLFTDGAYANEIVAFSDVTPPTTTLEKKETRMIMKSFGGKDPLTDPDEKRQLSKYYFRTADRIVTRADLKLASTRFLIAEGIHPDDIIEMRSATGEKDGHLLQQVSITLNQDVTDYCPDLMQILTRLKALIVSRSVNTIPVELKCIME